MNSAESKKREAEYRAEEDLRTITRAEEIRSDQSRMAGVSKIQRKQLTALQRVGKAINGTQTQKANGTTRRRRRGASQRA
jgi:hypothetical protein